LGFYFIAKMLHIYVAFLLALITLWARAYPRHVLATCCHHTCQGHGEGDKISTASCTYIYVLSLCHLYPLPFTWRSN
jgi:hypothetical protein